MGVSDSSNRDGSSDDDGAMNNCSRKKREGIGSVFHFSWCCSFLHPCGLCLLLLARFEHVLKEIVSFHVYLGIENLQGFCKQNQKFSTTLNPGDVSVNRESVRLLDEMERIFLLLSFQVRLLQCLYEGSLYKIEKIHNQLKHLSEPHYEYSQCFAKSYNDKVRARKLSLSSIVQRLF